MTYLTTKCTGFMQLQRWDLLKERSCLLKRKSSLIAVMLVTGVLLQACSGAPVRKISEKNKDTTGVYNGNWLASVTGAQGPSGGVDDYSHGFINLDCPANDALQIPIVVSDGKISAAKLDKVDFLNTDGQFKTKIPTDVEIASSEASGEPFGKSPVEIKVSGSLKTKNGWLEVVNANYTLYRYFMKYERDVVARHTPPGFGTLESTS